MRDPVTPETRPIEGATMKLTVLVSGAFSAALKQLKPVYERQSGAVIHSTLSPSMGDSPDAIPAAWARRVGRRRHHGRARSAQVGGCRQGRRGKRRRTRPSVDRDGGARRCGSAGDRLRGRARKGAIECNVDRRLGKCERNLYSWRSAEAPRARRRHRPEDEGRHRTVDRSGVAAGDFEIGVQQYAELVPSPASTLWACCRRASSR